LQSHCAINDSDRFSCNDQSHCNETCEVFDCKFIETRLQVSYFYYLHASFLRAESFQQTIIAIEDDFGE